MTRSSRHKSRRQSRHSSRDCSDSEDAAKMKEKSSKDDGSTRVHRESVSGEKRKISSLLREGKEISGHGNGDVVEGYFSSKRRKEKADVSVGDDRWDGGGDEREGSERHKGEILKLDRLKESSSKGESLRVESKSKSGCHDSGVAGERKDNGLVFAVVDKEKSKAKEESRRKFERDSSLRKEGKESKDKERRSEKERKIGHAGVKLVDMDVGKKEGAQLVDLCGERQSKISRENNAERTSLDKDMDNKIRKKRRGYDESTKYYDEPKESVGKRVSSKDLKHRDDIYQEDGHKDRRRDAKYREETDKENKNYDEKYREDGERDSRRRDGKYCEDIERDIRYKDSKQGVIYDMEKRSRDSKYRDGYAGDHHDRSNKVSRRDDDDSPSRDDRATRYRDDQGRRRTNAKEDYNDVKSRVLKDQTSDAEKKSVSSARISGHARRRSSPTSSTHASRDNYRAVKQDDTKYRDYNYENRSRHNINSTRNYRGSENTSSFRSLDKLCQKDVDESTQRSGEELVPVPPPFRNNGVHNMQGNNAWRGVPSWLPPVPNGFLPFPHASPFPSPFHAHPIPFHMPPDTNMFSRPMWDMSNAIYGDESHMYRNMSDGRGWETSTDLWKDPNRTGSLGTIFSDKGNNNSIRSEEDGALAGQSVHPTHQNEHAQVDQKSDSINDVAKSTKGIEKNKIGDSTIFSSGVSGDGAMVSGKNGTGAPFCRFYLSKLDISEELAESEIYDNCMGLSDTDKIKCSDIDDSKILYMREAEDNMASSGLLRFPLSASTDDSVFKKAMSLYKIQKENVMAGYGEKPKVKIPNSEQDENVQEDQSKKLCLTESLEEKIDVITENPEDPVSALNDKEGSVVKDGATCINDEVMSSLDTNYSPSRNSDVLSLVNLSRIHDSPGKSTH